MRILVPSNVRAERRARRCMSLALYFARVRSSDLLGVILGLAELQQPLRVFAAWSRLAH